MFDATFYVSNANVPCVELAPFEGMINSLSNLVEKGEKID